MNWQPTKTIFLAFTLNTASIADYYRTLADELVERGYHVVIITDGKRTQLISEDTNPAIYTWPSKRPTRLADARFFSKLIQRYRPVLSFSNFGADNINLIVSALLGVPLRFVTYHTMLDPEITKKPIALTIQWQLLRKQLIYHLASMVLPVADAMETELVECYHMPPARIEVFHNALAAHPELFQREAKTQPTLVCAGALTRGKGHDVLINAMAIVVKSQPGAKLTIYGEGRERPNLEKLVQELGLTEVVKLPGKVSHEAVMQAMADSYVLIHPSRFEAFGYSVIEAFSVGTPAIASAVGGLPEIIREGLDGYLVNPDDPALLAERINQICSDYQLRQVMSQNCLAHFEEAFEVTQAVRKQADWLIKKIVSL